jgi:hypothetical protein
MTGTVDNVSSDFFKKTIYLGEFERKLLDIVNLVVYYKTDEKVSVFPVSLSDQLILTHLDVGC